jgi:hypothetical protein
MSETVADIYPGWKGITQPCDVCKRPVAVNAVSPSECHCSVECAYRAYGIDLDAPEAANG